MATVATLFLGHLTIEQNFFFKFQYLIDIDNKSDHGPSADLRDDKQYLINHPGATPISSAQASHRSAGKTVVKLSICVHG